jgi:SNF2 family DNA or RNA helicase
VRRVFEPHPYQRTAKDFLYRTPRAALWMPMGGGKTVTVMTALDALDTVEDVFPALVLAPVRVAASTWPAEAEKWAHTAHLGVSPVVGTAKQRAAALRASTAFFAMNYDNIPWLMEHFGEDWPFKTIVADEFTRLKSYRTRQGGKRAGALGKVAHRRVDRFIGLTGTPAPNGLKDLWGQMWFLDEGQRLGKSYAAFETRWFTKGYDGFSLQPMAHAGGEIMERVRDICLTVDGLPVDEPIVNVLDVPLPREAQALYDDLDRHAWAELEGEEITAINAAVKTSKCLQVCSGFLYKDEDHNWSEVHREKLLALESVIAEANGAPVLVAYNFVPDLIRLQKHFPQGKVLDKKTSTIEAWNRGEIPILFAHPASAGHGLNLQDGGNILVFFQLDWNLEQHDQIIERIGPLRQKQSGHDRPVFIHYLLVRDSWDETVLDRLRTKRSVQDVIVDAARRRKRPTPVAPQPEPL